MCIVGEIFSATILSRWNFYTWLPSSTILVVPHDRQSASIQTSSFSICSLAWCRYYPASTLLLGFSQSCRTPIGGAISFRHRWGQRCCEWLVSIAFPHLRRSIVLKIVNTVCARANTVLVLDIRAWRVHSRAPPTTCWWATRAKFGEIFVPIQSMSIERNFYPAKILCYTVY